MPKRKREEQDGGVGNDMVGGGGGKRSSYEMSMQAKSQSSKDECVQCYHMEPVDTDIDLSINKLPTTKDDIEQPELAAHPDMLIPPIGSSIIICGKSGSGKSTLLANYVRDGRFYGKSEEKPNGWFDKVFIFSPTADGDDIQRQLGIPEKRVFTDLEEAPEFLSVILEHQKKQVKASKSVKDVEQFLFIFDDFIGDPEFMNEKAFLQCFYMIRHINGTTIACAQHFKRIPRVCRLQANFIHFFAGSQSEVETLVDEFSPPMYTKNEFRCLVNDATVMPYSFLTINMKVGVEKRFRQNLDQIIRLDRVDECQLGDEAEDSDEESDDEVENYEGDSEDEHDIQEAVAEFESERETVAQYGRNEQTTSGFRAKE